MQKGVLALGVVLFALILSFHALTPWDEALLGFLCATSCAPCHTFFSSLTDLGSLWVVLPCIALMSGIAWWHKRYALLGLIQTALWGTLATTYGLKYLLERPRPSVCPSTLLLPPDPSFPSAHSAQIVLLFGIVYVWLREFGHLRQNYAMIVLALPIILVGFSRLYLQVHFPSDVLGGFVIAALWLGIANVQKESYEK